MHVEAKDFWRLTFIFPPQCDVTEVWFSRQVKYFWKQTTQLIRELENAKTI
jgi:hypothetical protein